MSTEERKLEENRALVRRWFEAMNERDLDAAVEHYADDYTTTLIRPGGDEEELDAEGLREQVWERNFEAFPDSEFDLKEMAAEGDWVLVRFEVSGTHEGEFLGVEPTGNEVEVQGYQSFRIEDGEFVESHGNTSLAHALAQIGVELPIEQ